MSTSFAPGRIREARLRAGLTQAQLARRADTTERNIVRWENGHNEPRAQHVAALAAATGVDPNYFFTDGAAEVADPHEPFPAGADGNDRRRDPAPVGEADGSGMSGGT